eukprot:scaffold13226_cov100-Skeletonema_marinoi.AAC.2
MVTKIVIRISSKGRGSAAEDSNRANDIKHLQKRQDDYSDDNNADDKYDAVQDNEEEEIQLCRLQGSLNEVTSEGICDGQSYHDVSTQGRLNEDTTADDSTHDEIDEGAVDICRHKDNSSKKRPLLLDDKGGTEETKRRKRTQPFIDLTDVPPQLPIKNNRKGASSKYQGVCFDNRRNEWRAQIMLDGKQHHIGNYENEEEAAVDYARVVFKYEEGKVNARRKYGTRTKQMSIDLTGVPPQLPILKSHGKVGSSKYQGVYFHKSSKRWKAQIAIDGEAHSIGNYDNEEEAAVDYARALFKYGSRRQRKFIDLTESSKYKSKNGSSKYEGVYFNKANNKWNAQITIDGKQHYIGNYDNEEEAAVDYARAAHTYGVEIIQKGRSSHKAQQDMRSSAECKNQTQHGAVCRKKYADSRPRIKGRFATQKSVVGGEDSA